MISHVRADFKICFDSADQLQTLSTFTSCETSNMVKNDEG
jgi:hypothetical protein